MAYDGDKMLEMDLTTLGSIAALLGGGAALATFFQKRADRSRKLQLSMKPGEWTRTNGTVLSKRVLVFNPSDRSNTICQYAMTVKLASGDDYSCFMEEICVEGVPKINVLPLEIAPGSGTEIEVGTYDLRMMKELPRTINGTISIIDVYGHTSSILWTAMNPHRKYDVLFNKT